MQLKYLTGNALAATPVSIPQQMLDATCSSQLTSFKKINNS